MDGGRVVFEVWNSKRGELLGRGMNLRRVADPAWGKRVTWKKNVAEGFLRGRD